MSKLTATEALEQFGVRDDHEVMPNGERRFRLRFTDRADYIRTEEVSGSGWQVAHSHKRCRETYVVERGWMALVESRNGQVTGRILRKDEVATTEPLIAHNVFLGPGCVIHTVKHGADGPDADWVAEPELSKVTAVLAEPQIFALFDGPKPNRELDPRFPSYVEVYNNLDNIIWLIPGAAFSIVGAGIAFLVATRVSEGAEALPAEALTNILGVGLCVIGVLAALSAYSTARLRLHHTRVGRFILEMERNAKLVHTSYFSFRERTLTKWALPPATYVFVGVLSALALGAFWLAGALMLGSAGALGLFGIEP